MALRFTAMIGPIPPDEQRVYDLEYGWICYECENEVEDGPSGKKSLCNTCIKEGKTLPQPKVKNYIKYKFDFNLNKWI